MGNSRRSVEIVRSFAKFIAFAFLFFNFPEPKADNGLGSHAYATCDCSTAEDLIACLRCCAGGCPTGNAPPPPGMILPSPFQEENEIHRRNSYSNHYNKLNDLNENEIKESQELLLGTEIEPQHAE